MRRDAGFTLLEVLVALALMGLLSAGLLGSFRFGQRAHDQAVEVQSRLSELRALRGFLDRALENAYPFDRAQSLGTQISALEGEAGRLAFTGPAGGGEWGAGWARYVLSVEPGANGLGELRAAWAVDRNGSVLPDRASEVRSEVLLTRIASLQWSYLDRGPASGEPPIWRETWRERAGLPAVIRLKLSLASEGRGLNEEWWFTPRITDNAQCAFDPVSERCRQGST